VARHRQKTGARVYHRWLALAEQQQEERASIAVGADEEEECFYFVDTRLPAYPVLYWTHDMFAVAASDLASFLAEMKA